MKRLIAIGITVIVAATAMTTFAGPASAGPVGSDKIRLTAQTPKLVKGKVTGKCIVQTGSASNNYVRTADCGVQVFQKGKWGQRDHNPYVRGSRNYYKNHKNGMQFFRWVGVETNSFKCERGKKYRVAGYATSTRVRGADGDESAWKVLC